MWRIFVKRLLLSSWLVAVFAAEIAPAWPAEARESDAKAVAAIEALGGIVNIDEHSLRKPVIGVNLSFKEITDADLTLLNGLTDLNTLDLSCPRVTDAGVKNLGALASLRTLDLSFTQRLPTRG